MQAGRHPVDSLGILTRERPGDGIEQRRGEEPWADPLERIGIGEGAGDRHESWRLEVDELARDSLAARRPQGGDHTLARINGHVTEAGFIVRLAGIGVDLNDDGNLWKLFDGCFNVVLE